MQPGRVEPAVVDGRGDRAAGLGAVRAVPEPALRRQRGDVGVRGVDALARRRRAPAPACRGCRPAGRRRAARAARGRSSCAGRGRRSRISRVAASVSPARALARLDFPTPDGPTIAAVRPAPQQRADGVQPLAGHGADRQHLDAERVLGDLLHGGRDVVAEVGLGEDDDRRRAAAPGDREVALHPPQPRLPAERVDDQDDVQVGRDDLAPEARPATVRTKAVRRGRTATASSPRSATQSPTAGPGPRVGRRRGTRLSPSAVSTLSRPRSTRDTRAGTVPAGSSASGRASSRGLRDGDGMFVDGLGRTGPETIVISCLQEHLNRCRRAPAKMFGETRRRDENEISGVCSPRRRATRDD